MNEAFRPVSLLVALWPTPDFQYPSDVNPFGERLRQQFPLFIEQRVNIPSTGLAQPEWPYLSLLAEQRHWALDLAPAKVSLRRTIQRPASIDEIYQEHFACLSPLQAWLAENHNFRVYRVGTVVQIFCNMRSSANEKIAQYFLQPRALQGQAPYDLQLSMLSRVTLINNWVVNRWLRVRPLRTIDSRRLDFAAQIELDISTMPEDTAVKTAPELAEFFEAVCHHFDFDLPILSDGEFVE